MKKLRKIASILMLAAAVVFAAGCTKPDEPNNGGNGGEDPEVPTVPTGAINGLFTVNSDGGQVYFSKGSLQFIGSMTPQYWQFAESQWVYIGQGQDGPSQNTDIDLFGWGTSGVNHGAVCYQPWSISKINTDYYAYGDLNNDLFSGSGEADWGCNRIINGGDVAKAWRTPTKAEWMYVFDSRSTVSGIRFAKAKVNEVKGVILLPDDWLQETYELNSVNQGGAPFNSNEITATDWISRFEANGAVFLPCGGVRNGGDVNMAGEGGYYWSSTHNDQYAAYSLAILSTYVNASMSSNRQDGRVVRLVHDAH